MISKERKEQNVGVLLILMVFIIGVVLSALNINERWEKRCASGEPFIFKESVYSCKKIVK